MVKRRGEGGEGDDSRKWISDALRMDTDRLRAEARPGGLVRHIEKLKGAGLTPADAANYASIFVASMERQLDPPELERAREIEQRYPTILVQGFGFFRGEYPTTSVPKPDKALEE